ncbi:hypothetical protein GA830_15985 [Mesorhizobium sp. NBSH29]|uniref:hypothetical protein n=1 Tax=Mesorhizobium sp. NBSH29 TaxID=2654249 RepID=UPI00189643CF|nr:hypothetical protein [Mesorhizobium sp. NBSH29]QPC88082.1 hypothetical protein GA830_15985 [Mesorhizobium sp. NBSH29]
MLISGLTSGLKPVVNGSGGVISDIVGGLLPGLSKPNVPPVLLPTLPGSGVQPGDGDVTDPGEGTGTPPGGSTGQTGSSTPRPPLKPEPANGNVAFADDVEPGKVDINQAREAAMATLRKERFRLMLEEIANPRTAEVLALMRPEKTSEGLKAASAEYAENGASPEAANRPAKLASALGADSK